MRCCVLAFIFCLICQAPGLAQNKGCDPHTWDHVYNPEWLHKIELCMTVKGTIYMANVEADGNMCVRVLLDPGQENLINEKNVSEQYGCLVASVICYSNTEYPDAIGPCSGFENTIVVPPHGTHVKITGTYVYNFQYGWYEIHPVSSIEIIR